MSFKSEAKKRGSRFQDTYEDDQGAEHRAARSAPDPDKCPGGWDADIWHLVLLFQQKAAEDEIVLAHGRPVLYSKLKQTLDKADNMMARPVPYSEAQLDLAFEHLAWCNDQGERPHALLKVPVYKLEGPRWRRVVELMMTEFWTRNWDAYAMDAFAEHAAQFGLEYQFSKFQQRITSQTYRDAWKREVAQSTNKGVSSEAEGNE